MILRPFLLASLVTALCLVVTTVHSSEQPSRASRRFYQISERKINQQTRRAEQDTTESTTLTFSGDVDAIRDMANRMAGRNQGKDGKPVVVSGEGGAAEGEGKSPPVYDRDPFVVPNTQTLNTATQPPASKPVSHPGNPNNHKNDDCPTTPAPSRSPSPGNAQKVPTLLTATKAPSASSSPNDLVIPFFEFPTSSPPAATTTVSSPTSKPTNPTPEPTISPETPSPTTLAPTESPTKLPTPKPTTKAPITSTPTTTIPTAVPPVSGPSSPTSNGPVTQQSPVLTPSASIQLAAPTAVDSELPVVTDEGGVSGASPSSAGPSPTAPNAGNAPNTNMSNGSDGGGSAPTSTTKPVTPSSPTPNALPTSPLPSPISSPVHAPVANSPTQSLVSPPTNNGNPAQGPTSDGDTVTEGESRGDGSEQSPFTVGTSTNFINDAASDSTSTASSPTTSNGSSTTAGQPQHTPIAPNTNNGEETTPPPVLAPTLHSKLSSSSGSGVTSPSISPDVAPLTAQDEVGNEQSPNTGPSSEWIPEDVGSSPASDSDLGIIQETDTNLTDKAPLSIPSPISLPPVASPITIPPVASPIAIPPVTPVDPLISCDESELRRAETVEYTYSLETFPEFAGSIETIRKSTEMALSRDIANLLLPCDVRRLQSGNALGFEGISYEPEDTPKASGTGCLTTADIRNDCTVFDGILTAYISEQADFELAKYYTLTAIREALTLLDGQVPGLKKAVYLGPDIVNPSAFGKSEIGQGDMTPGPSNLNTSLVLFAVGGCAFAASVGLIYYLRRQNTYTSSGAATQAAGSDQPTTCMEPDRPLSPFSEMLPSAYRFDQDGNMSAILELDDESATQRSGIVVSDSGFTTEEEGSVAISIDGISSLNRLDSPVLGARKRHDESMDSLLELL